MSEKTEGRVVWSLIIGTVLILWVILSVVAYGVFKDGGRTETVIIIHGK